MSSDAVGWTFRHSPHTGTTLTVHLAVADSVSDLNGNEFWMSVGNLATKARCGRRTAGMSLGELLASGCLTLLEERIGKPSRYRFEFPEVEVVYEARNRRQTTAATCAESAHPQDSDLRNLRTDLRSHDAPPAQDLRTNPREPKEPTASGRSKRGEPTPEEQSGAAEPNPVRSGMARIDRSLRDLCPPDRNTIYGDRRARLKALLSEGADVELAIAAIRQGAPNEGAPLRADRAIDAMERGKVPQGDRAPYLKPFVADIPEITDKTPGRDAIAGMRAGIPTNREQRSAG